MVANIIFVSAVFFYSLFTIRQQRFLLMVALCLLESVAARAQPNGDWYLSKILNDNNGLPQNSIRSMYYDTATSFLWLATEAGLVRYDGQDARVFDKREMPWLQSMRIHNLLPTVQGQILGCTNLGEIFNIHHNYPQAGIGNYKGPPNDIIYRIGNIKSIAGMDVEEEAQRPKNSTPGLQGTTLWLNDTLWITGSDSSILLMNNKRITYRWRRNGKWVQVFIARGKWIYAINNRGEGYCLDIKSKKQTAITLHSNLLITGKSQFIYNKLNDMPLLLQGNEVHEIVFKDSVVTTTLVATLPKVPGFVTAIIFDKRRRYLFISTNTTGLYIYHRSSFKVYLAVGDDVYNDNYACVLTGGEYIFTAQSVLFNMADGVSKLIQEYAGKIQVLASDTSGNIYAGLKHDIIRFNLTHPVPVLKIPLSKQEELLMTAYRGKNNRIWFSTFHQLYCMSGDTMTPVLQYPDIKTALYFITETPAGDLVGINQNGIFRADKVTRQLVPLLQNKELLQARSLMIDTNYHCWIATYGNGIFLYDLTTKKLTHLPADDKGYLQYGHVFIDDGLDNFLVPTNKGLFRLSKANLLQMERSPETPLCYQYFDVNDGLLTNEFNGGCQPAYNQLFGGDIVLPALQGLVRVKIKELPTPSPNVLFVDGIETRLNRYRLSEKLHFTNDERVQTWGLGFTQWDRPNMQGIFYRLDGDSTWQRLAVSEKQIRLSELHGGNHSLEIKHQYGLQPQQFTTLTCHFSVGRYYYETIWFWLIMALLLAAIIYAAVRIRSRQLKQKNIQLKQIIRENIHELSDKNMQLEETLLDLNEALKGLQENTIFKNRLIGLLGHDMLVPLRFIARVANHLHTGAATFSRAETEENSSEIENTATELLYLGESLIQWIKLQEGSFRLIVQPIDLRVLVEEIILVHKSIAAIKGNKLICTIAGGLFVQYDPVFIKVIVHNLLLNANKFTAGGNIRVGAVVHKNELQIQVADTGIGMNENLVQSLNALMPVQSKIGTHKESGFGMGYMLIIDLLRFAEGTLLVESKVEMGTVVIFKLPF